MAVLGSPNYRVGLIIANAQPFHNGHIKIIGDALMTCDEVIISFKDYDTSYFNYDINQQIARIVYDLNPKVSFFGTKFDETSGTPKHYLEDTLSALEVANYNMPTHFFTNYDTWIDASMELHLETIRVSTLADNDSYDIKNSIEAGNDLWESKVPYAAIETIKTYIATKNRNF